MITEIIQNKDEVLRKRIYPNLIFNRFDLWFGVNNYELYDLGDFVVPVKTMLSPDNKVYLEIGLYLTVLPKALLDELFSFLFQRYPQAKHIRVMHSYTKIANAEPYPYWHIDLPSTKEEFDKNLSSRVRYNTKWYPKKLHKDVGNYEIKHFLRAEITPEIVARYIELKQVTHPDFSWSGQLLDYLNVDGITDGYVLYVAGEIKAIAFTSNTGENVMFCATTYDTSLRKYSIGNILYYHIICDLIDQGKKKFYLSGGWMDYKKYFNGILTYTLKALIPNPNTKQHKKFICFCKRLFRCT